MAVGTESNYFGLENVKQHSLPMKTVDDALNLRNHILTSFEKAVQEKDEEIRQKYQCRFSLAYWGFFSEYP